MTIIDDIKERIDLVAFIAERGVQLRRVGRAHQGFCPFHPNTRTPAFTVYRDTQSFYCFGCGASGTVFDFVMRQDGLDFRDALAVLATHAGVNLDAYRTEQRRAHDAARTRLLDITHLAARYFNYLLVQHRRGQPGRDYVASRGLDERTIETFQLGYALNDWGHLLMFLTQKHGYPVDDVAAAGLIVRREQGGYYDRFRGRLVFPIRNEQGEVVGFGGRLLHDEANAPKYLNTPQTLLFDKSRTLYGLDQARDAIRASGEVVVVEGYLDVLTAHQYGFRTVVAPLGTALTSGHATLVQRLARRVVFALDADDAGQRAVAKGIHVTEGATARAVATAQGTVRWSADLDVRVVRLPDGDDPDSLIRRAPPTWQALLTDAVPVIDYWIQVATGGQVLDAPAEQDAALRLLIPVLAALDGSQQAVYAARVARLVGVREERVLDLVRQRPSVPIPDHTPTPDDTAPSGEVLTPTDALLAALLAEPALLAVVDEVLAVGMREEPQAAAIVGQDVAVLFEQPSQRALVQCLGEAIPADSPLAEEAMRVQGLSLPSDRVWLVRHCAARLRFRQVAAWGRRLAGQIDDALAAGDEDALEREGPLLGAVQRCLGMVREVTR